MPEPKTFLLYIKDRLNPLRIHAESFGVNGADVEFYVESESPKGARMVASARLDCTQCVIDSAATAENDVGDHPTH